MVPTPLQPSFCPLRSAISQSCTTMSCAIHGPALVGDGRRVLGRHIVNPYVAGVEHRAARAAEADVQRRLRRPHRLWHLRNREEKRRPHSQSISRALCQSLSETSKTKRDQTGPSSATHLQRHPCPVLAELHHLQAQPSSQSINHSVNQSVTQCIHGFAGSHEAAVVERCHIAGLTRTRPLSRPLSLSLSLPPSLSPSLSPSLPSLPLSLSLPLSCSLSFGERSEFDQADPAHRAAVARLEAVVGPQPERAGGGECDRLPRPEHDLQPQPGREAAGVQLDRVLGAVRDLDSAQVEQDRTERQLRN
eukprot:SAG22_NODE_3327_length_1777_cov_2.125745_3_plen_305_part_00